jgi:hypothetical protein
MKTTSDEIIVKRDDLLKIKELVEDAHRRHNQLMQLQELMIKFATKYPDVVKEYYAKK